MRIKLLWFDQLKGRALLLIGEKMVPRFEKRVRGFAIDTSAMALVIIISLGLRELPLLQLIILIVAFLLIYIMPYLISSGQTFGKRVEKIKVVNLDGTDVAIWKVLLREITKLFLSVITFGLYLVVAFFALSERGVSRTIHDYVFKTKVIDLDTSPHNRRKNEIYKTDTMKKTRFDD